MRKAFCLMLMAALMLGSAMAQTDKYKSPYNPKADAMYQLDSAIDLARKEGKYVVAQVGYNKCPWCIMFNQYKDTNEVVHKIVEENFVWVHINYNAENRNPEAMMRLANPARFGFPVLVILNEKGEPIHIQNSAYLEEGRGYNQKKVADCLLNWTPKAVKTLK